MSYHNDQFMNFPTQTFKEECGERIIADLNKVILEQPDTYKSTFEYQEFRRLMAHERHLRNNNPG